MRDREKGFHCSPSPGRATGFYTKDKWTMSELIAMCVQEEERLKVEKLDVAHLTITNSKKRKGNCQGGGKGHVSKVPKIGANVSSGPYCKFCCFKGHYRRECPKFKAWLTKKGIPFNPDIGKKAKSD
ncbi:unnamed protein product [Cuscuta europaea]|uniref:CCHC-type domain-containing protein n=1 Tax=Cuscuta europaea TaxID=41803 RepID=A0A9P1DX45_CUSEU|nr:unnamed protein product [Cuscuta europaea]